MSMDASFTQEEESNVWEKLEQHDSCVCPLTLALMKDPVSTIDGHTYEREAIEEWLRFNETSPVTGLVLESKILVPNFAIKKAMEEFMKKEPKLANELVYVNLEDHPTGAVDKHVSILVVGTSGVGKSSLLQRFCSGTFTQDTSATYGIDFKAQTYKTGSFVCQAKVWDTSGQAHLRDTVRTQYRSADCIIFVFDVTRPETLEQLIPYIEDAKQTTGNRLRETILLANKIDESGERSVTAEQGSAFVEAHGLNDYREVSAKNGANVARTFENILTHAAYRQPAPSGKNIRLETGAPLRARSELKCC